MRFVLERVTAPESEPVSLAEMRQQVHEFADITANDVQYASLITTAREWVEDFTGRALIDQKWRLTIGNALPYAGGDSVSGARTFQTGHPSLCRGTFRPRREDDRAVDCHG
jgi:uncharacterized phiE125 gp8 family phage protein